MKWCASRRCPTSNRPCLPLCTDRSVQFVEQECEKVTNTHRVKEKIKTKTEIPTIAVLEEPGLDMIAHILYFSGTVSMW